MLTQLHTLKRIASMGSVIVALALIGSCSGAGLGPSSRGTTPDLVVAPPSVSDAGPVAGSQFTLWATVRNVGDGASEATRLRYFQSTDATITTADTEVSADTVPGLAASQNTRESVDLTAPAAAGTYYYGACVDAVSDESDTTNNCSTSVRVDVVEESVPRGQSDLVVVSPSVSDNSPNAGTAFTLSATVMNDGEGGSEATTLRYYRSTDGTITSSDVEVGTDQVAGLAASGTSSQSVELTAPRTPGTYYFGACADAVADESDTGNNCSASVQVMVPEPNRPDLMVTAPSVTDSGPDAGAPFTLSATVSNDGEGGSEATTLRYYRSTDGTITSSDMEVGTNAVAGLAALGSASESIMLSAPSTPGAYYYGACVDAVTDESDTTNNCSTSVQVTVPQPELDPELAVASVSVSDSAPASGTTFTLSATVRNDGEGISETTTLRYYQSRDARISTSDTEVGSDAVAELAASGSASESVELTAPASAGTYYYGVCVDAVTDESDTTNNCSRSVQITVSASVTEPQGHPDLLVTTPSVNNSEPAAGMQFILSVTVTNDGDGGSEATTLRYYMSTDATVTTSDSEVGTGAAPGLGASGSSSQSTNLTAPASPGTYYYGACVDAVADESDTTNNCSTSARVTVPQPKYPDLVVVGTPSVSDNAPAAGATFTLSATVRNDGDSGSEGTTLRYYRSTDATITTSDTQEDTDAVAQLAASGSSSQSVDLTAPASPGTYYYGACVDAVTDESDTTNNCSTSVRVTVPQPKYPDLVVGTPTVSNNAPAAEATFNLSATVRNDGDSGSDGTTLRYYRSTDATITTSDAEVGTGTVPGLGVAGSSSQSVNLAAPSSPGTYYYGACVDAVTDESDTTNNCSSSVQVTVPQPKPDLVVGSPSVDDDGPGAGGSFTLSATVENEGAGAAAATTLRYYRSTDATITASDAEVGTDSVAGLAAAATSDQSVDLTAPSNPGTYYYGACVDAVTDESDTTNNCSTSVTVTVPQPKPDLVVGSPSVDNDSPAAGGSFTLSATVENEGAGAAAATTLRYYRSTDATITTSDAEVGTDSVAGLAAAATSDQSVDLTAPSSPGTYYYGACVDAVTDESDTTNNCSTSVTVTVPQPKPDLVVGSPSVDNDSPAAGGSFTLSATVENEGAGAAAATTLRYYRSTDATITTSDTEVGTDSVAGLAAAGTSDQSVDLTAPSNPGTYYYGACVDAVTDESDTTNNCSTSVTVTVPQPKPDLVVGTPSVDDDGPAAEAAFTLSATVANAGGAAAAATTLRYYRSTDATIATSDTEVGTDSVAGLAAAGTSDQSVDLTAPSSPGTYYYGACVDAVTDESDTTNNCSTSVEVTVPEPGPSVEVDVEDDQKYAPVGDTVELSARVLDDEGEEITGATVSWSSSDTGVATVDSSGVMTAVGTGWVTLTATATVSDSSTTVGSRSARLQAANSKQIAGSVRMHVVKPVARIDLAPDSLSFDSVNEWETLTATLYDADDNVMQPTYWGWSSANKEVATVHGRFHSSQVQASVQSVGEGSTTVSLRANGSATGTASVTVTLPTARVTLSPASLTFTALSDTKTVTVTVLDENGDEDEDATFGYIGGFSPCCGGLEPGDDIKSYDIEKTDDGLVITAEGTGTGRITVCSPSCFKSPGEESEVEDAVLLLTIYQDPASLTISPDSVSLAVDGTATLRAAVADANGNDIRLAEGDRGGLVVYWETSASTVATVEGATATETRNTGATATVTAEAAGSATITGRWGGSVSGTATVTVTGSN